jgi:hypothetical protein
MGTPDYAKMPRHLFDRVDGARLQRELRVAGAALRAALAKLAGQLDVEKIEGAVRDVRAVGVALWRLQKR